MTRLLVTHFALILLILLSYPSRSSGTTYSRLTFQPTSNESYPDWSPNSATIAFRSDSLPSGIWTIPASGGLASHLALVPDGGSYPAWSPDGSQIAYSQGGEIWVGPASGDTAVQLTSMGPNKNQYHPAWSPDGSTIAFTSFDNLLDFGSIWKVPASGGTPILVRGYALNPSWAPDGSRIAYEQSAMGFKIAHMAPDGSDEQILTLGPGDFTPAWSPDGNWIAFFSNEGGTTSFNIWVISPEGDSLVQVTDDPLAERHPAWSPDGNRIVFTADWTGDNELWVASDLPVSEPLTPVPAVSTTGAAVLATTVVVIALALLFYRREKFRLCTS